MTSYVAPPPPPQEWLRERLDTLDRTLDMADSRVLDIVALGAFEPDSDLDRWSEP